MEFSRCHSVTIIFLLQASIWTYEKHKYGGPTMVDIASCISDVMVYNIFITFSLKRLNCSYIHKISVGDRGVKLHKNGAIFNHL
jgi:hypothetical protein